MTALCVFGAQWGDEGKGKIIDFLSGDADVVVRFQGGANAGHTVVVGEETFILHLIPSGILREGKRNVIGDGVALDPLTLLEEIEGLRGKGIEVDGNKLRVSARAHVIFNHHRRIDAAGERWLGEGRIGTTGRGIGPCYSDKASRTGLRVCDLLQPEQFRTRLRAALAEKNAMLSEVHGEQPLDLEEEFACYSKVGEALRPFVGDTGAEVRAAHRRGERLLFEGAQGILLDIDGGTYPYVTSSNTGPAGLAAGAAFPPNRVEAVLGIAKAYTTRVGEGPFPTELLDDEGDKLQERGVEFGATTGRRRRCGWFDALAVRYAVDLSGTDSLVMTKLDVLSGFETLKVGVAYSRKSGGGVERFDAWPAHLSDLEGIEVEYEDIPGWTEPIDGVRRFEDLPAAARNYVERIETLCGVPISMISVGPERDQVIRRPGLVDCMGPWLAAEPVVAAPSGPGAGPR